MSLWWLAWESNPILERYERRDLTVCPASYIKAKSKSSLAQAPNLGTSWLKFILIGKRKYRLRIYLLIATA